jgi:hypothetical protein
MLSSSFLYLPFDTALPAPGFPLRLPSATAHGLSTHKQKDLRFPDGKNEGLMSL